MKPTPRYFALLCFLFTIVAMGLTAHAEPPAGTPVRFALIPNLAQADDLADAPAPVATPQPATPIKDDVQGPQAISLELKPIRSISLDLTPPADKIPEDVAGKYLASSPHGDPSFGYARYWGEQEYLWVAPSVAYYPLYFEDENLERYGHHHGIAQPLVSATKFYLRLPAIPYMVGARHPKECRYSLGCYRPGDCVPHFFSLPPWSPRGAVYQAAAVTGAVFVIP